MKYLVLLVVILAVVWLIRTNRRSEPAERGAARPGPAQQEMVQCPVCQVHLPRADALPGPDGQLYCCAEHRRRAEA